ncbi:Lamina-associated polypeptide 2, isoform alpha [Varanus komodoensis]|nr:Lamina-associated polypeptide 2, isoform alpha [Varanus komodoensis]
MSGTTPRDKEGRKIDLMVRRIYAAMGLGLRISNYKATMVRYQYFLMQQLDGITSSIPEQQHDLARVFIGVTMQLAIQQLTTVRHHVDCDSCTLVGSVALRRPAWLRSCNFPEETKKRIKGMPFDGLGLFHDRMDHKLKHIYNAGATARKMEIPGSNRYKWQQSRYPRCQPYHWYQPRQQQFPQRQQRNRHRVHQSTTQFSSSTGIFATDPYGQTLLCSPLGPEKQANQGTAHTKTVGPYGINYRSSSECQTTDVATPVMVQRSSIRQHGYRVLPEQAGRYEIGTVGSAIHADLGLVYPQRNFANGKPSGGNEQPRGRHLEQESVVNQRVGIGQSSLQRLVYPVGYTSSGPVRDSIELEVCDLLLQGRNGSELTRGCLNGELVGFIPIRLSTDPVDHPYSGEGCPGPSTANSHYTVVALPTLVLDCTQTIKTHVLSSATNPSPDHTEEGNNSSPRPRHSQAHRVAPALSNSADPCRLQQNCSVLTPECQSVPRDLTRLSSEATSSGQKIDFILQSALHPSTRRSYEAKWKRFTTFAGANHFTPESVSIDNILSFLLSLHQSGLKPTSVKVCIAAISHFRGPVLGLSVFSHALIRHFLKGLQNLHPPVRPLVLTWSLSVVLHALTEAPFEPLAMTELRLLSWKVAVLVAITSVRRASELSALCVDPPYLNFHKEKVVLRTDPAFLSKVATLFHVNRDIVLPAFFPSPSIPIERSLHSLDVRRCLAFYRSHMESFRKTKLLFIKYSKPDKGAPLSAQRLSKWIVQTIELAYQLAKIDLLIPPKGHYTRAMVASSAFSSGIPLLDICKSATWTTPCTFTKHYRLDVRARKD